MHGYEPGYGPPPPGPDLYGPGPHPDLPLMVPGPPGPHGHHLDPMSGPGYHDLGAPHPMEHGGPGAPGLPPHGEEFGGAFGEPGDCGQTIEGKV